MKLFLVQKIQSLMQRRRRRLDAAQYIRGYQRYPETPEEVAFADVCLDWAFSECPWEPAEQ